MSTSGEIPAGEVKPPQPALPSPRRWTHLALVFASTLIPLGIFGNIAEDVWHHEPFAFEEPLMWWVHAHASRGLDSLAVVFSWLGSRYGMVPLAGLLCAVLGFLRRRLGVFAFVALAGTATMNFLMKLVFLRPRPTLWTPAVPENDTSFPSGHSMFAVSLAATLVAAVWHTRWRWPVLAVAATYAIGMMASRVYIGVHYPTDVLGGACFSLAWVSGLVRVLHPHKALKEELPDHGAAPMPTNATGEKG